MSECARDSDLSPSRIEHLVDLFWSHVRLAGEDECWEWLGARGGSGIGYGLFRFGAKKRQAHRLSLAHFDVGILSTKLYACHTCDNPPCVNPSHLYWGTPSDNMRDRYERSPQSFPTPKKECRRGHPLSGENLYIQPSNGNRLCRSCVRIRLGRETVLG